MKKICLLAVSFLMGHSLTNLNQAVARKSIDIDDRYFQSLCPSFSAGNNTQIHSSDDHNDTKPLVKIDREDTTESNDSLLKVSRDCAGSISNFRKFTKEYFPEQL
jgi:hypothetical protein